MGRTATAFLVLIAVGGCVADDQGPAAAVLAAQQGPPMAGPAPTYATWNKTDQFAVLQDSPPVIAPVQPAPAPVRLTTTTVLKPAPTRKPIVVPAPTDKPQPADPIVDPDLAQATLVQAPGNTEPAAHDGAVVPKAAANADTKPVALNTETKLNALNTDNKLNALNTDNKLNALNTDNKLSNLSADNKLNNLGGDADPPAAPAGPAAGASTRMVNSKRITLNYELKDSGNSGVTGVELWCTQDTRTWRKGEIVAQTNHSYTVEVKDEGLYGFTLLPRSGSGAAKEPPQPGDQPQVWVSVDVTKPVVQITSLDMSHSARGPAMTIRWTAKDKDMGPRPISLAFAEEPEGPWTPIAAGLENNGQYEWQPTGGVPHHLYVRVEATDLHGNVGQAQTANPLRFDTAGASAALPAPAPAPTEAPAARKPLPPLTPPPAFTGGRPSTAILGVESNDNN